MALSAALVLAAVGALLVDIPALALGVDVTASHLPPGLSIADTAVQDVGVRGRRGLLRAARRARGQRRGSSACARRRFWRAVRLVLADAGRLPRCSASIWDVDRSTPKEEKLLEQLGTNESTLLLVLSAALTCVVAPICEEFLFRGYIFTALRNWRGRVDRRP